MESNTRIRTDLLRKLAEHLLHGELGHKRFDFRSYNSEAYGNVCGTAGCAMGETPIVFPDKWEFAYCDVYLKNSSSGITLEDGVNFFKIDESMYAHLFYSERQNEEWGPVLFDEATKEQVAENILRFCELAENGEIV